MVIKHSFVLNDGPDVPPDFYFIFVFSVVDQSGSNEMKTTWNTVVWYFSFPPRVRLKWVCEESRFLENQSSTDEFTILHPTLDCSVNIYFIMTHWSRKPFYCWFKFPLYKKFLVTVHSVFCAQKMHNNYQFLCVCVFAQTDPSILNSECVQVSFAYEGEFILEAEYWETLSATQHQEMPRRVHSASHNPLIP